MWNDDEELLYTSSKDKTLKVIKINILFYFRLLILIKRVNLNCIIIIIIILVDIQEIYKIFTYDKNNIIYLYIYIFK